MYTRQATTIEKDEARAQRAVAEGIAWVDRTTSHTKMTRRRATELALGECARIAEGETIDSYARNYILGVTTGMQQWIASRWSRQPLRDVPPPKEASGVEDMLDYR